MAMRDNSAAEPANRIPSGQLTCLTLGLPALVLFLATVVQVRLCVWILRPVNRSDVEVRLMGCGEAFLGNLHLE